MTAETLRRILAFAYRNAIMAKRNAFFVAELLFWPTVSLISVGLMGDFLKIEKNVLSFVLSGAIAAGVLQVAQLDVGYSLLYDVWSKSMKHTFLAPVAFFEFVLGSWIIGIVRGVLVFGILLIFSKWFFAFSLPGFWPTVVFLVGLNLFALVVGMFVCFLILNFGNNAEVTAWTLAYLLMLLCGLYYPVSTLPGFFRVFAQWVPITYFMEFFRTFYGFPTPLTHCLLKGFSLTLLYGILSLINLNLALNRARRSGVILRLSE